jgi:hypothetical protein
VSLQTTPDWIKEVTKRCRQTDGLQKFVLDICWEMHFLGFQPSMSTTAAAIHVRMSQVAELIFSEGYTEGVSAARANKDDGLMAAGLASAYSDSTTYWSGLSPAAVPSSPQLTTPAGTPPPTPVIRGAAAPPALWPSPFDLYRESPLANAVQRAMRSEEHKE